MAPGQILFFGDSITLADNDSARLGWPGRLCRGLCGPDGATACYNLGIDGDTSRDIAFRWRAERDARAGRTNGGEALLFAYGFNDAAEANRGGPQVPLEESLALSRRLLTEAKGLAPTLWIGPTPLDESVNPLMARDIAWVMRNDEIARYNGAYARLAAETGVPYLDLFTPFVRSGRYAAALLAGDRVHPGDDGYAMIAEAVGAWSAWHAAIGSVPGRL